MLVEICLPVKNEEKILAPNLQRVLDFCRQADFSFHWKIIGLVNGSTDNTLNIFSEFKKNYPQEIDYIEISEPGKGRAIRQYWALSQADILSYLDIDLAVLPSQLPELIWPLINNQADLSFGSRLLKESNTNRSLFREASSRAFNFLVKILLPNKVSDLQCGFKAIRRDVFRKILPYLKDDHWLFDSELVLLSQHFSYRLKEFPVDWDENRYQKRLSKVRVFRDLGKFLAGLIRLRFRLFFIPKS